ncbi:MAG: hypothetical protein PVH95_00530 [Anaerolineae bacterium]
MRYTARSTRRVLLVVMALLGLVGPFLGLALPRPVLGSPAAPLDLIPRAYLPLLMRPEDPVLPDLAIYDMDGVLQDWDWLVDTFGPVELVSGTDAAKVIELRAADGYATLLVRVENSHGEPLVGQEVVFHWPDAPELPAEKQACGLDRGVVTLTKETGTAEFPMGGGSYYNPDLGDVGPHVVWILRAGTDCLRGLGMLTLTNHVHLDSVWRLP